MAYPVVSPSNRTSAVGQKVAGSAIAAAGLYILGTYLPLVSGNGGSFKLSDGDGAVWMWVVPAVVAIVAAGAAFAGKAVGGTIAAGVVTGLAGMSTFQLIMTHKAYDIPGVSKGAGYWALTLAVTTAIGTAVTLLTSRAAGEPRCDQATSLVAAVAFLGVPAAILLPADGFNPLADIDDGLIKFGLVVWALLAPGLALALTAGRRQSGVAFGAGVAFAHLGYTVMVLQSDSGGSAAVGVGHTAIYHWTMVAALALTSVALARSLMAGGAAPTPAVAAAAAGQWAPDPYGRHQYRWWDGVQWTGNVSDHGVVGVDQSPVAQATPAQATPPLVPRSQWRPPNG